MFTFLKNKRIRFFLTAATLTGILAYLSLPPYSQSLGWALALPFAAFLLVYLSIGRPNDIEVVTIMSSPTLLALGASLSQFFYPNLSLPTKVLTWGLFFLVFYTLLLALNVFRIERIKGEKIPLERAAKPTVFLLSFLIAFLLLASLHKLELGVAYTTILTFLTGFIISLNLFWFFSLTDLFEPIQFFGAAAAALGLTQVSLAFSFFPLKPHLRGLSESVFFYGILGVARAYFDKHLKLSIILEYIFLSLAVFFAVRFLFS